MSINVAALVGDSLSQGRRDEERLIRCRESDKDAER